MSSVVISSVEFKREDESCQSHLELLRTQAGIIRRRKNIGPHLGCQFIFDGLGGVTRVVFTSESEDIFNLQCTEIGHEVTRYSITSDMFRIEFIEEGGVIGRWEKASVEMLHGLELEYPERVMNLLVACSLQS